MITKPVNKKIKEKTAKCLFFLDFFPPTHDYTVAEAVLLHRYNEDKAGVLC